ncbi:DUF3888 domain-containing protein [Geobacillus uzenensis]|uniref:DUF3888 domain-containing protein n=1 Tax=Geobacillus uzenensis TaxID=129339 RepID=UPI00298FE030|nr:DUF3888 domain-containing protein [Geobacillus uzenensis]
MNKPSAHKIISCNKEFPIVEIKGAHNPPYGMDIITLEINFCKIRIIDYKHIEEKIKNNIGDYYNNRLTNQRQ